MKIKTKKQMNFAQLIEWAMDNGITDTFYSDDKDLIKVVDFYKGGLVDVRGRIYKTTTFTVEVEETVTEDTVIPKILVKTNYDNNAREYCNSKINRFALQHTKAIYIVNDDFTLTLIWRDGKLVE